MKKTKFFVIIVAVFLLWLSFTYYQSYRRSLGAVVRTATQDYSAFANDTIAPRADWRGGYYVFTNNDCYYAITWGDSLRVLCMFPESARLSFEKNKEEKYTAIKEIMTFFYGHNRKGIKIANMDVNNMGMARLSFHSNFHTTVVYTNWADSLVNQVPPECRKYDDKTYYRIKGLFDYVYAYCVALVKK